MNSAKQLLLQTPAATARSKADILPARRTLSLGSSQYDILTEKRMPNCTFYRARDIEGGREVAIKELDFTQLKDRKIFDLAKREAGILQSIDHPNVVKCLGHHSDEQNGKFFIITEWIEGRTLKEALDGEGRLVADRVNLVTQLLEVVSPLHSLNPPIIHRDIKPENVMLCADGGIKLVDFGFSVSDRSTGTTFCAINSLGFTAPEVAQGFTGDARSDLFSIGAIYLWLKTGKTAFDLCDMGSFKLKLPDDLAAADKTFLAKALAYVPDERFRDAREMKAALRGIESTDAETRDPAITELESSISQLRGFSEHDRKPFIIAGAGVLGSLLVSPYGSSALLSGLGGTIGGLGIGWLIDRSSRRKKLARLESELEEKKRLAAPRAEPSASEMAGGDSHLGHETLLGLAKSHPSQRVREGAITALVFKVARQENLRDAVFKEDDASLMHILGQGCYMDVTVPKDIRIAVGKLMVERLVEGGYWDILIRFGKFSSLPAPLATVLTMTKFWQDSHYGIVRSFSAPMETKKAAAAGVEPALKNKIAKYLLEGNYSDAIKELSRGTINSTVIHQHDPIPGKLGEKMAMEILQWAKRTQNADALVALSRNKVSRKVRKAAITAFGDVRSSSSSLPEFAEVDRLFSKGK